MTEKEREAGEPLGELLRLTQERWPHLTHLQEIENPDWPDPGRTRGDWRQYIHWQIQELWPDLSVEARLVAYYQALHEASYERDSQH